MVSLGDARDPGHERPGAGHARGPADRRVHARRGRPRRRSCTPATGNGPRPERRWTDDRQPSASAGSSRRDRVGELLRKYADRRHPHRAWSLLLSALTEGTFLQTQNLINVVRQIVGHRDPRHRPDGRHHLDRHRPVGGVGPRPLGAVVATSLAQQPDATEPDVPGAGRSRSSWPSLAGLAVGRAVRAHQRLPRSRRSGSLRSSRPWA